VLTYGFHPAADIFPMMEGIEFDYLVKSIRANGLQIPILTYQGTILDGRNRCRACKEAGVEPKFEEWDGKGNLIDKIIAFNLHRRHLSESQRAMIADEISKLEWGKKKSDAQICASPATTQDEAAKALGVSRRSVQKARKLKKTGTSEVVEKVKRGELSLDSASKIAEKPPEEQKRLASMSKRQRSRGIAPDSETLTRTPGENKQADQTAKPDHAGSLVEEFAAKVASLRIMIKKAKADEWADLPKQTVINLIKNLVVVLSGVKKPDVTPLATQDETATEESAEVANPDVELKGFKTTPAEQQAEEGEIDLAVALPDCFGNLFDLEAEDCKGCTKQAECGAVKSPPFIPEHCITENAER